MGKFDILLNIKNKEMERIEEEEKEFLNNLEKYKNKIKNRDFLDIKNWDSYKKKTIFKSEYKKNKKIIEPFILKLNQILFLIKNKKNGIIQNSFNLKTINYNICEKKYIKIQLNKLKHINKKNYFSINKVLYILLDIRKLKTKLIIFNKKGCLFYITNGLVFKKLNLKNKKNKKSEKTTNLLLKNVNNKKKFFNNYSKIIFYVKGVKKYINNIIKYVSENILKNKNFTIIMNQKTSKSKYFNFKKIKAIKRRLKKKIIKLK